MNLIFLQHQVRKILGNEAHSLWFRRVQFSVNERAVVLLGHSRAGWGRDIQAGGDRSVAERNRQGARFRRVRNFHAASLSVSPSSHTLPDKRTTALTKTTHCLKKTWFSLGPQQWIVWIDQTIATPVERTTVKHFNYISQHDFLKRT